MTLVTSYWVFSLGPPPLGREIDYSHVVLDRERGGFTNWRPLLERIRAVLRRAESKADFNVTKNVRTTDQPFDFLGAQIHPERLEATFPNGASHKFGRKEIGILAYLHTHRNVVITRKELTVLGTWGSEPQHWVKALELLRTRRDRYPFHELITHRFGLHQLNEALDAVGKWQTGKAVVLPNS